MKREEILKEIGLWPLWRRRALPAAAPATPPADLGRSDAVAPATPPADLGRSDAVAPATSPADLGRSDAVAPATSPALNPRLTQGVHHRGYLPHLKAEGGIYFVTFRLADSLPQQVLAQLGELPQKERNKKINAALDAGQGECWLQRPEIAQILKQTLLRFDGGRYKLHAWVIMPNHVHMVVEPLDGHTLSDILQGIKSVSAHQANELLGRRGEFWQHESHDHLVRDENDYLRCCEYVKQNPVTAGLAGSAEEYAYSGIASGAREAGGVAGATKVADAIAGGVAGATEIAGAAGRSGKIACMDWGDLKASVASCTACKLAGTRTQTVFGVGDERASWLFVGEGPGAEEDARGEPFVGQAGKLLDNMLAAIGLKRGENVYIANVVKCRPPGNRNPEPEEAAQCHPYLQRQIALIRPKLIVALGRVAAQNLLDSDATIASLRGRLHDHGGIPLIVTYHPAYLLRNLPDKARAWQDLCFARATMEKL